MVRVYPKLKGARNTVMDAHSTVGLVEYDTRKGRRYMMLDLGMSADWSRIHGKMRRLGCRLADVTHILQTHWDEDHFENITRFPHVLCVWGGMGPHYRHEVGHLFLTGTNIYVPIEDVYPNGFIEDASIRYYCTYRAHSRDEIYYIIDSENEGKIAFVGDLIHFPLAEHPDIEDHKYLDRTFALNIFRKYTNLKEICANNPDLKRVYAGHAAGSMTYDDLRKYITALESKDYREIFQEYLEGWKSTFREYEEILKGMSTTGKIEP